MCSFPVKLKTLVSMTLTNRVECSHVEYSSTVAYYMLSADNKIL